MNNTKTLILFFCACLFTFAGNTHAQSATAKADSLIEAYKNYHYEGSDTLSNPYLYQLFAAPTYYTSASDTIGNEHLDAVNYALRYVYTHKPWLIENASEATTEGSDAAVTEEEAEIPLPETEEVAIPEVEPEKFVDPNSFEIKVRRPNFWKVSGAFSSQFMQVFVTDNWYQGGESNYALMGNFYIDANYNNKKKFTWDNKLEARLGFQTSKSDQMHKFKTNSDLLRMTNKIGIQASKRWYYTLSLQTWTQMYMGLKSNDAKVYSDFMSPFESLLSLGMDYKYENKKFKTSISIAPIAVDLKHVSRHALREDYGIKPNHHNLWNPIGSNITINYQWQIAKWLSWQSRAYMFASYLKATRRFTAEWENTFSLKVNKYLSTQVFLYPRFDNSVKGKKYFQFKEQLSVGLDVTF